MTFSPRLYNTTLNVVTSVSNLVWFAPQNHRFQGDLEPHKLGIGLKDVQEGSSGWLDPDYSDSLPYSPETPE